MLRTWDNQGRQTLSPTDPMFKFFGSASIGWDYTGGAQSGYIDDARFTAYPMHEGVSLVIDGLADPGGYYPSISVSGNRLTWFYRVPQAFVYTRPNTSFIYGVA